MSATVLEVAYVLESARAGYGWERHVIGQAIEAVIDKPAFKLEHADALRRAITSYRARSVDLWPACVMRTRAPAVFLSGMAQAGVAAMGRAPHSRVEHERVRRSARIWKRPMTSTRGSP